MQCIIANVAQIMTWRFAGKIQLKNASQPAVACGIMPTQPQARCKLPLRKQKELNLEKQILLLREMLSYGTKDLIEMHDCYRQTWVQLFWIPNLKMHIFFCLNILEIWTQTIFEVKGSLRDPAVFQPYCCVSNIALRERANTAAAVIVHTQIQLFFESNILNLK